ncbi:MAG: hypothetical protein E7K92_26725, partial [Serratia marcescens]|nr:hypothetical protein [Serratia marcescens]
NDVDTDEEQLIAHALALENVSGTLRHLFFLFARHERSVVLRRYQHHCRWRAGDYFAAGYNAGKHA